MIFKINLMNYTSNLLVIIVATAMGMPNEMIEIKNIYKLIIKTILNVNKLLFYKNIYFNHS